MTQWKLVPDGFDEAVDAAKEFYELYKRTVVSGCTPMEQLRFVAALKLFDSMLSAPAPDVQPVAWSVFDKRTQKHWYTNESVNTAGYYAKEYSHREPDGSPSMLVVPLYEHPPAADVQELERNEQYQIQMAAISTASLGYWQEGDEISPDYDTVALRDTANLYDRYKAERADALELVEALKDLLYQAKLSEDEGGWDFKQAQAALKRWEGK
jgi:hypothetical protein